MKRLHPEITDDSVLRYSARRSREGAAMVEAAFVLPIALVALLIMLDLGMAVARSNSLSDCARHVARIASLHGADSASPIGPQAWSGTLAADHPFANSTRSRLLSMSPGAVQMSVEWPNGDFQIGHRVEVSLTFQHSSLLPRVNGLTSLRGESAMRILR